MKKSQRLRLAELKGKATTTEAEKAELATLEVLAAAHPDASQDIDDLAKKPLSVSEFLARLTAAFADKAELTRQIGVKDTRIAELEAQLSAAKVSSTSDTAALAGANAARGELDAKLTAALAVIGVVATALGLKAEDLAGKDVAAVQGIFNSKVTAAAGDKLAELGFPASGLPATAAEIDANTGDTLEDLRTQMSQTDDPAKAGELAAKARAAREKKTKPAA